MSVTAFLGLGGNVGDPVASMAEALRRIDRHPDCAVKAASRLYRTPPWGKTDQDWFFNAAAAIETTLSPHALLDLCLEIERAMKRIRMERWGPRTLDMDILAYGDLAIHDDGRAATLAVDPHLLVVDALIRDGIFGWALSALYFHGVLVGHPLARANGDSAVRVVLMQHRLKHRAKKTQRRAGRERSAPRQSSLARFADASKRRSVLG